MCKCDKSVWSDMTAEEQRLSVKRPKYAFVTVMNKYKKKDSYNYMPKLEDASILNPDGSMYAKTAGGGRRSLLI